ncbi:nitroreductase [Volucribacter psittacicida]|uniref:Putative NAD(P)H nitroreductase n=1 Tax=Volucribacter psittacicida TaxID=203482 RepID=A0A4R1G258_9PAST|nr:NAD(P)H nitroreductase [Volucribacter psittacicida]TCK01658.1 nitroreductase [Volucribacter psittacicida]
MDLLTLLTTRRSEKKLIAPAPNAEQLENMFQAALHVPDHGKLRPYRFVVIEKEGLAKLVNLLKQAVVELELGEERIKKAESFADKAPMIIAVVAKIDHTVKKVPGWEQMLTAGCATYALQLAANAQGFANVWVTGPWIDAEALRQAFGCQEQDKIVALMLVGTEQEKSEREIKALDVKEFISYL